MAKGREGIGALSALTAANVIVFVVQRGVALIDRDRVWRHGSCERKARTLFNAARFTAIMHVALVLGGDQPQDAAASPLQDADLVVTCDSGAHGCLAAGRSPDVVVGDMDSIDPDTLAALEAKGATIQRHPVAKHQTDGELGLEHAIGLHPDRISILGGSGGRTAMVLSHIGLLTRCHAAGIPAQWISEHEHIELLPADTSRNLDLAPGTRIDLVALDPQTQVEIDGFRYSGHGIHLPQRSGRGISNVVEADPKIRVSGGSVLLVVDLT